MNIKVDTNINMQMGTKENEAGKKEDAEEYRTKYWGYYLFIFFEAVLIMFYGLFTKFGSTTGPFEYSTESSKAQQEVMQVYPMFQDVHVMIFIGFGFLMTFLKKHSWSAVGINFLLAAWTIQVAMLTIGFFRAVLLSEWKERIALTVEQLVNADFAAASVLIAFGAVLGKLHLFQYLIMATMQTFIYGLQMNLGYNVFNVNDVGGSITIHLYGAYFGLIVALITTHDEAHDHPKNKSNYHSNLFSMIGTIFLWMYWPSFNAALSSGLAQHRTIINTVLSLTGSCVMVFLFTPFTKSGKLHMEFILNATLAGGVIIGASADLIVQPWVSFIIGCVAGSISLLGFEYIGPYLNKKIGLQDTCGVHSLHGIPGFLGGIISAIIVGTATPERYGDSFSVIFPKISVARSNGQQAGYQLATIATSLGLALFGGTVTGFILRSPHFPKLPSLFEDEEVWEIEEDSHHSAIHKKDDYYVVVVPTQQNGIIDSERVIERNSNKQASGIQIELVKNSYNDS